MSTPGATASPAMAPTPEQGQVEVQGDGDQRQAQSQPQKALTHGNRGAAIQASVGAGPGRGYMDFADTTGSSAV